MIKYFINSWILMLLMAAVPVKAQTLARIDSLVTIQLRTNTLYDLALCPNVGIEIQTAQGCAWQLDYIGAWWNSDFQHRYWSTYGFQTELRYYWEHPFFITPFKGHHVGLYSQWVTYDFEFGGTGYQSRHLDQSWGVGVSYGYSIPFSDRWSLDLTAGLGYFQSRYDVYEPCQGHYWRTDTRRRRFFGPTKLEASLVWNLNKTQANGEKRDTQPQWSNLNRMMR